MAGHYSTTEERVQGEATGRSRRDRVVRVLRSIALPAVLAVLSIVLVSVHVATYDKLSPMDELQHIDFLLKAPAQVRAGEKVSDEAMEVQACRGLDYDMPLPPCVVDGDYDPDDFQEAGYNTASVNTPVYYTATKVVAALVAPFSPGDELFDDARLAGSIWLALGVLLTFAAGRRLGIAPWPLAAVLVAVISSQTVLFLSSTITPDATALAVGAGAVWTVLWWEERPARRWPVLVAMLALALTIKMTHVVVWFAVGLYVLLRLVELYRVRRGGEERAGPDSVTASPRALLLGAAALVVTVGVVLAVVSAYQARLAIPDAGVPPMQRMFTVDFLDPVQVVVSIGALLNPLQSALVGVGSNELSLIGQRVAGFLILAGLVGTAVLGTDRGRARTLAQAGLLTGLAAGPALVLVSYLAQGVFIPPPPRYAITLVPLMVLVTAHGLRSTSSRVWVSLAALGCLGVTLVRLTAL